PLPRRRRGRGRQRRRGRGLVRRALRRGRRGLPVGVQGRALRGCQAAARRRGRLPLHGALGLRVHADRAVRRARPLQPQRAAGPAVVDAPARGALTMRLALAVVVTTLLVGLSARGVAPQNAPAEQGGWNPEGAAKYLDDRMDAWFAGAKRLRTGQGETPCISCHTAVPYALSRPALRRAMHVTTPTPQEVRLLEGVIRRVETYDTHQLFEDFN